MKSGRTSCKNASDGRRGHHRSSVRLCALNPPVKSFSVQTPTLKAPTDTADLQSSVSDEKASACPYTALKSLLSSPTQPKSAAVLEPAPAPPGPPAFSLESAMDVGKILTDGINGAMLHFESKYGDVCRYSNPADLNGASGWVFINNPENVQHCCMDNVRNYQRRYLPDVYKYATHEKGILGSQDAYNTKHRRMCSPPFRNPALLKQFSTIITDRASVVAETLSTAAQQRVSSGKPLQVDISVHTQRLTLDIVGLTAFSHDFKQVQRMHDELFTNGADNGSSEQDRLLWAVNTFGEVLAEVFITPLPVLRFLDLFGFQSLRKLAKATDIMRESMLGVIAERREMLRKGVKGPDDLLTSLLAARDDDGTPLTDEELWEDVHDIMGAGHETTATTTAAAIYCITAHPEVEQRLVAQLRSVCGDRAPTFDDLENLPYLKQVVKEVLRLYPAIPIFPREALGADVLPSGHRVDAGDVVFMSSYALGRSKALWDDPLEFNPDRFSPENAAKIHRFQFLPFGAGPRMCLGANWAEMSVALMTGTLIQRLKFTPVSPTSKMIPVGYDITMNYQPTNGLHMICEPRA